ncbi:hypothetical protein AgCh_008792 [Apium graveolens]
MQDVFESWHLDFGWLPRTLKRALVGLSYVRFRDVFLRYHPFSQSEELFRGNLSKEQLYWEGQFRSPSANSS